jgi:hypothetical protein
MSLEENCMKGCTAKLEENFCHFAGFVEVKAGLLKCSWYINIQKMIIKQKY